MAAMLALAAAWANPVHAVSVGQVDTFEDGTTLGWSVAVGPLLATHPAPPYNDLGGPAGADDNFLHISSVGVNGPGSRLTVLNYQSQWAGDYLSAGISSIAMDVINLGNTDLNLRLLFEDPLVGPPENVAFSAVPILVQAGSGWTSIQFELGVADLEAALGDVTAALTNATILRIYHSSGSPGFPPEPVVSQLGIDNIRALGTPVPEGSATVLLLGCTLTILALLRVRHSLFR